MIDSASRLLLPAATLVLLTLSGCDNPACVFGGDCNDSGGAGGVGAFGASFPENHEWVRSGAPGVVEAFPSGTTVGAASPLVLYFDESMAEATLDGAFELVETSGGGGLGGGFGGTPLETPELVGNGRVLVLRPQGPLTPDASYELRRTIAGPVTDLEGSGYTVSAGTVLTTFTVEGTPSTVPRLVASFPQHMASGQSATGEIVTIFDRAINPSSITLASFAVTVNGNPPAVNPLAQLLSSNGASDGRVLLWNAIDTASGEVSALASGASVQLTLSPVGASLLSADAGTPLGNAVVDYTLADFQAPTAIALQSAAGDAIGIDDLVGAAPFSVDLTFSGAQDGDRVNLFLFGADPDGLGDDIALLREKTIQAVATDTWTAAEMNLAGQSTPVDARLGDGFVAFAFSVERAGEISPVRVLDVDALESGIQDAALDTTRPTLVGFGADGSSATSYTTDQRDLVLVGRASEELAFADVDAPGVGTHSALTNVVGSSADGAFIARRLAIGGATPGLLDAATAQAGVAFTVTLYDRARNASNSIAGTFFQVGASGPGLALPGGVGTLLQVEVRRADTLAAISNAQVFVHEGASGALVDVDQTNSSGLAGLDPAGTETVLTVDAAGFELFTWQGVPTDRLSILLVPTSSSPGLASGSVSSPDAALETIERFVGDSRRFAESEPLTELLTCSSTGAEVLCPFNPGAVVPQRAGALGFLGVVTPASEAGYSPTGFLRAFALDLPAAGVASGAAQNRTIEVPLLLDDPLLPSAELPVDGPAFTYQDTFAGTDGNPRVLVEGLVHGLAGAVPIGAAVAFDQGAGAFRIRSAIPGIANAGGSLVTGDVIDPSLFVSVESRDALGNRAGRRPRVAQAAGTQQPPRLPTLVSPAVSSTTSGASYTLSVTDVLPDGIDGLYEVRLRGANGRVWRLLRVDPPGSTTLSILVPDIAAAGGTPLPGGTVVATSSVSAWGGFDASELSFSDLERLQERFATAVGHTFSQP